MEPTDAALALGATLRLTRLVVSDEVGLWYLRQPAYRWAHDFDPDSPELATDPRQRLVSGLDCPFCVGYWIGVGVLAAYAILPRSLWRFGAATLSLNETAAHLATRLGDVG